MVIFNSFLYVCLIFLLDLFKDIFYDIMAIFSIFPVFPMAALGPGYGLPPGMPGMPMSMTWDVPAGDGGGTAVMFCVFHKRCHLRYDGDILGVLSYIYMFFKLFFFKSGDITPLVI